MADRFLIDGWYALGADGEYHRLYPIKGTPAVGDIAVVNSDGVLEFVPPGSIASEPLIDDASGEFLYDDATGDLLMEG